MRRHSARRLNYAGTPKMRVWMSDIVYESSVMWVETASRRRSESL